MVPPAGNDIFDSFFSDLAVLPILPETVSSKLFSNLDFIIESILANYKKNFMYRKDSCKCFTEIAFSTTVSTAGKSRDSRAITPAFNGNFAAFIVPELIFLQSFVVPQNTATPHSQSTVKS